MIATGGNVDRASDGPDRPARLVVRRVPRLVAGVAAVALAVLALGAAAGRWQVVPAERIGAGVPIERGDLVVVVPVSSLSLRAGDSIYLQYEGGEGAFRSVAGVVDSWAGQFEMRTDGDEEIAQLPPKVWRVSRAAPKLGLAFGLFAGPAQSIVLVLTGIGLIALSQLRRTRAQLEIAHSAAEGQ